MTNNDKQSLASQASQESLLRQFKQLSILSYDRTVASKIAAQILASLETLLISLINRKSGFIEFCSYSSQPRAKQAMLTYVLFLNYILVSQNISAEKFISLVGSKPILKELFRLTCKFTKTAKPPVGYVLANYRSVIYDIAQSGLTPPNEKFFTMLGD